MVRCHFRGYYIRSGFVGLGVKLFAVYITNLDEGIENVELKFADDTKEVGKLVEDGTKSARE